MKRVHFQFAEKPFEQLNNVVKLGRFDTLADAVRSAVAIEEALLKQAHQGFTEVVVRNPESGKERILILPGN
jgi:hypothetical protein